MKKVYYNEFDPVAAEWLKQLLFWGHLPDGDVDERDIRDVTPNELQGYDQCHFFAGIGVWPHALGLAGWQSGRPVWTGSCPCQPFSGAGRRKGTADERHLWPHWFHLIGQCEPDVILGEQVASKDALAWVDLVSADLEGAGYAAGFVDTCAAGFGAPHIRQRIYFGAKRLGDADSAGPQGWGGVAQPEDGLGPDERAAGSAGVGVGPLADAADADSQLAAGPGTGPGEAQGGRALGEPSGRGPYAGGGAGPGPTNGFWGAADWLKGRDGKWWTAEPGALPLANGLAARVGRLRGYGGALVAPQAAGFVSSFMETIDG